MIKRIVECSPWLRRHAKITSDRITFPELDAVIIAIPSDYRGAAGGNQNISVFDEAWAYSTENAFRLVDELAVPPTRKVACRLTVTYAGFSGESTLLEGTYARGMALPEVGPSLHAGNGMLFAWHTQPIAPWQTSAWLDEMRRSLRPTAYARLILNQFVSPESVFVPLAKWDACVHSSLAPPLSSTALPVYVGIDASTKRDSTALVMVTFDKASQSVRLIKHRVFVPTPGYPIDFGLVEETVLQWCRAFRVRKVYVDPYQMTALVERLQRARVPIEEYNQTPQNLTAAVSNLFDLIQSRALRLCVAQASRAASRSAPSAPIPSAAHCAKSDPTAS